MKQNPVLRITSKYIVPPIILFALFVLFHGEYSPGGGFQAGVIIAAAMILYTLVFGLERAVQVAPPGVLRACSAGGVLIYAGTGVAAQLLGGNFLDYSRFMPNDTPTGEHYGILAIELGVGLTVATTLMLIFFALAGRRQSEDLD